MLNYYGASKKYEENLKSGGALFVTPQGWGIHYVFYGPDARYNSDDFTVDGTKIDSYIDAWSKNFAKYLELKKIVPENGSFETAGEMGYGIYIGGYRDGVVISKNVWCKQSALIRTEKQLQQLLDDYEYCKSRGEMLMQVLFCN